MALAAAVDLFLVRQLCLDEPVDSGLCKLSGHADPVANRTVVRRAGIGLAFEGGEGFARKQRSDLGGDCAPQRVLEHVAHQPGQALTGLERHIAYKAIANDHISMAVVEVTPFHVADESERQCLEQRKRFTRELVALAFFFADGK